MARTRMTERETEKRMMDAAIAMVHERGISTGLESIAFDEVIRRADVSRTSAYRRWPTRDRFYGEILIELAQGASLPSPEMNVSGQVTQAILDRADRLGSPQARRDLIVELLRVAIGADFELVSTSPEWRTYRLLLASYEGIADDDVRQAVIVSLTAAEHRALTARARVYAEFTALLGYRLIPPLAGPDGFEFMSRAAGAMMRGVLGLLTLGDTALQTPRPMRAFGTSTAAEWVPAVYMVTGTVLSYIEPDPGIEWDRQILDDLVTAVGRFSGPGGAHS